jgi:hypothetical protein
MRRKSWYGVNVAVVEPNEVVNRSQNCWTQATMHWHKMTRVRMHFILHAYIDDLISQKNSSRECAWLLLHQLTINYLICLSRCKSAADLLSAKDRQGYTPLHYAVTLYAKVLLARIYCMIVTNSNL